jgi:hypothetical protein
VPDPNRVAYLTQTTLSLDEARDIIHALKLKFPNIVGPHSQDICYATENRQVRSATWRTMPAWCWSWVPPTAPTPTAWSRSRATWAPSAI